MFGLNDDPKLVYKSYYYKSYNTEKYFSCTNLHCIQMPNAILNPTANPKSKEPENKSSDSWVYISAIS